MRKKGKNVRNTAFFLVFLYVISSVLPVFAVDADSVKPELNDKLFPPNTYLIEKTEYNVAPGVYETHFISDNDTGTRQNFGYALTIDMNQASVIASYKNQSGEFGMQTVRDQAYTAEQKRNVNVVAGVNADIFNMDTGEPTGYLIMDGVKYSDSQGGIPAYFAILKDGTPVIRERSVPVDDVKEAVGVWSIIVKDGINQLGSSSGYVMSDEPRTCLGIKADGSVVLLVVDGRQAPKAKGVSWSETADFLISMGCVIAGELDGGGSTTFISQHEGSDELVLRNNPSDEFERPVSSALMVVSNYTSDNMFDHAVVSCDKDSYEPKSSVAFSVVGCDLSGAGAPLPSDGYFALSDTSFGSINKDGVFVSNGKIGNVTVKYTNGARTYGSKTIKIASVNYSSPDYTGLVKNNDGTFSFKFMGNKITSSWRCIGQDIYYFDENGNAVTGKYKITEKVSMKRPEIRDFLYNEAPVTLEYAFDDNGKLIKGAVISKNGATYYSVGGFIQYGWHYYDNAWHYFDSVAKESNFGKMLKGKWTRNYNAYECDSSGRLTKGFVYVDVDTNNKYKLFAGPMKYLWAGKIMTGWQTIDGLTYAVQGKPTQRLTGTYYFDYNNCGYLATDTAVANGETLYFNSDGTAKNGAYYDGSGELLLNNAAKLYGWQTVDGAKYYYDKNNNGYKVTDTVDIDGKTYYFNSDGSAKNGLVKDYVGTMYFIDGVKFFGEINIDGKLYYFDPNNNGYHDAQLTDDTVRTLIKIFSFIQDFLKYVRDVLSFTNFITEI